MDYTIPDMFSGMEKLIAILEEANIKLDKLKALEMFGRDGTWHTESYVDKVKSLEIWEVDIKWENELKKNFPNAKIKILDSIRTIYEKNEIEKFGFIVIDNPQMLYGPKSKKNQPAYCEHFEVLKKINKILDIESVVIFNVNLKPFNYDKWPEWKKCREIFYGDIDTGNMNLDFLLNFYKKLFENLGLQVLFYTYVKRVTPNPVEILYYFAYKLKKYN